MTPEEADLFVADNALGPEAAAERARWQAAWAVWCGRRGQDPDLAPGPVASAWLATVRREDGRPASGTMLSRAALAVDAFPARRALPAVREDPAVRALVDAAARRAVKHPPRLVLDAPAARLLLSVAPPPAPAAAVGARTVLTVAADGRTGVAAAADDAVRLGLLQSTDRARGLAHLEQVLGGPGTPLWDDPASLPAEVRLCAWHRLHPAGVAHLRLLAGCSLGLHCALDRTELRTAERGGLRLARNGLALALPRGTAHVRRAHGPVLCAIRHTRRWLRALGPLPGDWPLLCATDKTTGRALPTAVTGEQWDTALDRAAARAGLRHLSTRSFVLGYLAIGDRDGATIPALAAGTRAKDHKDVQDSVRQLRNRTVGDPR